MRSWVQIPPPRILNFETKNQRRTMRRKIIAVIGGSQPDENSLKIAEKAGLLIAQRGAILITGGLGVS